MARVSVKPVEPLEIEFADGTIKTAVFDIQAFILFTEEFGPLDEVMEEELKEKPYEFASKLLYCGLKKLDRSVTLEEAQSIAISGGEPLLAEIIRLMIDNFMNSADEESKKKFLLKVREYNSRYLD